MLNRISAQFTIGKWTDPGAGVKHTGAREPNDTQEVARQAFVANTNEHYDWLRMLPQSVLECVSLERVTTKLGSVTRLDSAPSKTAPDIGVTPKPKGLNYSKTVLVPTNGDIEQWRAAADFCCGYLCVIEDSYAKARKFDFHTATTPFRHLIKIEKSMQVKWIKYYTAAPMSQILGEELPSTPNGLRTPVFFSGKFRQFMHQRCLKGTRDVRNYRNAFNLLQGVKKACQPISQDFIKASFEEHRKTMSTPCPVNLPATDSQCAKYRAVWLKFKSRWERYRPVLFKPPGPSATLEWPRKDGGGSYYAYRLNEVFDRRERWVQSYIVNHQIINFLEDRGVLDCFLRNDQKVEPLWSYPEPEPFIESLRPAESDEDEPIVAANNPYDQPREGTVGRRQLSVSGETYLAWSNYSPDWDDVMQIYDEDDPKNRTVMVEGCVEPLKLRTITKGPCHRKWLSQSLQREMADCLDRFWQFSLNKRNTDTQLVRRLFQECEDFHARARRRCRIASVEEAPMWWCSGDYKSATDSISIHHTKAALETLLSCMSEKVSEACKRLYRKELFEQLVKYPEWTNIEEVEQVNGQLMGSVLSFPILCIINFVAYWESLEEFYGKTFGSREIPCLIHGDDILFRTTHEHYAIWSEVITRFGLKKSVGKNYFHPKVFTIDSELWIERKDHSTGSVYFHQYHPINCGSLMKSKVDGRTGYQNAPIWDKFNSSIRGAQNKELFVKRFLHFNRSIVKPMTWTKSGVLNLFLPHMRGGLGFELPWKADEIPSKEDGTPLVRLTRHQLNLASALCNSLRDSGPLKAYAIVGVKKDTPRVVDEKRYRLPFKYEWKHESEYVREIPGETSEPILSQIPEGKSEENRIRKPSLKELAKGPKRFRMCKHPPITCGERVDLRTQEFRVDPIGTPLVDQKTFPTEIWGFPYVETRVIEPEVFWQELTWAIRKLQGVKEDPQDEPYVGTIRNFTAALRALKQTTGS